jgi:hypothetical protein
MNYVEIVLFNSLTLNPPISKSISPRNGIGFKAWVNTI